MDHIVIAKTIPSMVFNSLFTILTDDFMIDFDLSGKYHLAAIHDKQDDMILLFTFVSRGDYGFKSLYGCMIHIARTRDEFSSDGLAHIYDDLDIINTKTIESNNLLSFCTKLEVEIRHIMKNIFELE